VGRANQASRQLADEIAGLAGIEIAQRNESNAVSVRMTPPARQGPLKDTHSRPRIRVTGPFVERASHGDR
jgi:glutamate/tyrosine decarboxylase-like PLP-dependent enzyme